MVIGPQHDLDNIADPDEIAQLIGADGLIYLDLAELTAAVQEGNPAMTHFDVSVFDGKYITGDETEYLNAVAGRHE